jgi:hypothetical protein
LQISHILPAFVFKGLKKGGPIRNSSRIDQRVQDGEKQPWLCRPCEGLFCDWETRFANNIFHPAIQNRSLDISYGDWLLKFCVSVSWRTLQLIIEQRPIGHFSPAQRETAHKALAVWAEFLRGERKHPGEFEQHLIPFAPVKDLFGIAFPPNINRYLMRHIEIDVACSQHTAFVFSKLGPFGLIGFIQLDRPGVWKNTRVRLRGGALRSRKHVLPLHFGKYLAHRSHKIWSAVQDISAVQRKRVFDTACANIDNLGKSDVFKTIEYDVALFGDRAFVKQN